MKVIILGAGQVGASVAEGLVSEENDITVVDSDGARLMRLQDKLDLRVVVGNAATPSVLRQAGVNPARMELEITESMLLGEDQHVLGVMRELSALGLTMALDDFGTGYSNLAYLQRFPIHTLKIDKTFIQDTDANRSLAELIVSLSTLMKLTAVAEGVETQEQLDWVAKRGIAQYQGYLYARPMPVQALTDWLLSHPPKP